MTLNFSQGVADAVVRVRFNGGGKECPSNEGDGLCYVVKETLTHCPNCGTPTRPLSLGRV